MEQEKSNPGARSRKYKKGAKKKRKRSKGGKSERSREQGGM